MYKSAGFMTFEHTKVEDCLYYSLSPLCTVFTIIYLKHIVFLEYIVLHLFCSLLYCTLLVLSNIYMYSAKYGCCSLIFCFPNMLLR